MKSKRFKIFALIVLLILTGLGIAYWFYSMNFESTDDAFLEANVVPVSSRVSGYVQSVHVTDNQSVDPGQGLVDLDPQTFKVKLEQAEANLAAAQADVERISGDLKRYGSLVAAHEISPQKYSNTQAEHKSAEARLKAAQARKDEAALDLSFAQIKAPWAGRVTKKSVEVGAYVQVGQPLLAIVSSKMWVNANFKENQIQHMRPGQKVSIKIDALGKSYAGHIDSIQAGSGARFSLFPPENATGNFVKVVQRVPVKIVFDEYPAELNRLGPGFSVVPEVTLR